MKRGGLKSSLESGELLPETEEVEEAQNSAETAYSQNKKPLLDVKEVDSTNSEESSILQTSEQLTESETPADIFEEISKELDLVADSRPSEIPNSDNRENPNLPLVQVSELILTNQ